MPIPRTCRRSDPTRAAYHPSTDRLDDGRSGGGDHHHRPEMVRFCWLKSQSCLGEREKNDSGLYLMV